MMWSAIKGALELRLQQEQKQQSRRPASPEWVTLPPACIPRQQSLSLAPRKPDSIQDWVHDQMKMMLLSMMIAGVSMQKTTYFVILSDPKSQVLTSNR